MNVESSSKTYCTSAKVYSERLFCCLCGFNISNIALFEKVLLMNWSLKHFMKYKITTVINCLRFYLFSKNVNKLQSSF